MRFRDLRLVAAPVAGLALTLLVSGPTRGDEPGRLGRLLRLGSGSGSSSSSSSRSGSGSSRSSLGSPSPATGAGGSASATGRGAGLAATDPYQPIGSAYEPPALSTAAPHAGSGAASSLVATPRIAPKPRVNKGVTEADPLVTRIALGRADGGSQFAMVTQIYADGTVIDSMGVHKITAEQLKPVVEAISGGDFSRIRGHCGGPAGDTFENFQVVTFERAYGRLRANSFSYSGNPQGCDHSVGHLHKILEDLQMKLATPSPAPTAAPTVAGDQPGGLNGPISGLAPTANLTLDGPLAAPAGTPVGPTAGLGMPALPDPGLHD